MLATIIITVALVGVVAWVIRGLVLKKRSGENCCSGSVGCSGCSGSQHDSGCCSELQLTPTVVESNVKSRARTNVGYGTEESCSTSSEESQQL